MLLDPLKSGAIGTKFYGKRQYFLQSMYDNYQLELKKDYQVRYLFHEITPRLQNMSKFALTFIVMMNNLSLMVFLYHGLVSPKH